MFSLQKGGKDNEAYRLQPKKLTKRKGENIRNQSITNIKIITTKKETNLKVALKMLKSSMISVSKTIHNPIHVQQ